MNLNILGDNNENINPNILQLKQQQQLQQSSQDQYIFNDMNHSNQFINDQYQSGQYNDQSPRLMTSEQPMPMDEFFRQQHPLDRSGTSRSSSSSKNNSVSNDHELSTDILIQSLQKNLLLESKSGAEISMNYSNSIAGRTNTLSQRNNSLQIKTFSKQTTQFESDDEVTLLNKRSEFVLNQFVDITEDQENTFQNLQERTLQYLKQLAMEKVIYYKNELSKILLEQDQFRQESQQIKEKFEEHMLQCESGNVSSPSSESAQREEELNQIICNLQKKDEEQSKQLEVKYALDQIIGNVEQECVEKKYKESILQLESDKVDLTYKCELLLGEKNQLEMKMQEQALIFKQQLDVSERKSQLKGEENNRILKELNNYKSELQISQQETEKLRQSSGILNQKAISLEQASNELNSQLKEITKQLREKESIILQFDKDRLDQTTMLQKLQEELALKNDTLERFKTTNQLRIEELTENNKLSSHPLSNLGNLSHLNNLSNSNEQQESSPNDEDNKVHMMDEIAKLKSDILEKDKLIRSLKFTIRKERNSQSLINGTVGSSYSIKKSQTPTVGNHNASIDQSLMSSINNMTHNQSMQHQETSKLTKTSQSDLLDTNVNNSQLQSSDREIKGGNSEMQKKKLLQKIIGDKNGLDQNTKQQQYFIQDGSKLCQDNTKEGNNETINNTAVNITCTDGINNTEIIDNSILKGNVQNIQNMTMEGEEMLDIGMVNRYHQRNQIFKPKIKNGYLTQQSNLSEGQCNQSMNINDSLINNGTILSMQQSAIHQDENSTSNMNKHLQQINRRAKSMNSGTYQQMMTTKDQDELNPRKIKEAKLNRYNELKKVIKDYKKTFELEHQKEPKEREELEPIIKEIREYKKLQKELAEMKDIKKNSINDSSMNISTMNAGAVYDQKMVDISTDINNISTIKAPKIKSQNSQYKYSNSQILNQSQFSHNSFYSDQNQNSLNTISVQLGDIHQGFTSTATSHASKQTDNECSKGLRRQVSNLEEANQRLKKTYLDLENGYKIISEQNKEQQELLKKKDNEIVELKECVNELKDTVQILTTKLGEETKERKILHNIVEDMKGKIRVFCRVRPPNDNEVSMNAQNVVEVVDSMNCKLQSRNGLKKYQFDSCFGFGSTQEEIFNDAKKLIQSAVDGYNVCIFAYGQTGSGKTFTMQGSEDAPGITLRSVDELYNLLKPIQKTCAVTVSVYIMELYKDNLIDLLATNENKLEIKEDLNTNTTYVQNATIKKVMNKEDLKKKINEGIQNRKISKTQMNAESSRSHLIITVQLKIFNPQTEMTTNSKISLIDLAGSERIVKSGANPDQIKEATSINQSLSALGDVISALTNQNTGDKHIPYRNNKLTYLMKDSLGGNAKTLMVVNVSPSEYNQEETQSSLNYATRVKTIVNETSKNIETREYTRLKDRLQMIQLENDKLQSQLSDQNRNPNCQQNTNTNINSNNNNNNNNNVQAQQQSQMQQNKSTPIYTFGGQQKIYANNDEIQSSSSLSMSQQEKQQHQQQPNQQQIQLQYQQKLLNGGQHQQQQSQQQPMKPSLLAQNGRNGSNVSSSINSQQQINQLIYNQQQQQQHQQKPSLHQRSQSPVIMNSQQSQYQSQNMNSNPHMQITSSQLYGSQKNSQVAPLGTNININNIPKMNNNGHSSSLNRNN